MASGRSTPPTRPAALPAHRTRRRSAGFVTLGRLVGAGLAFAVYAGWCFSPAWVKHSQLEGSVQRVLEHARDAKLPDRTLVQKALVAAEGVEVPLEAEEISVRREARPGERTIHVEFAVPVEVEFLGSRRTVVRRVAAQRTFAVDEAEWAREERRRAEEREAVAERQRRNREGKLAFKERLQDECRSESALVTTHVMVTHPSGERQMIDCSSLDRW